MSHADPIVASWNFLTIHWQLLPCLPRTVHHPPILLNLLHMMTGLSREFALKVVLLYEKEITAQWISLSPSVMGPTGARKSTVSSIIHLNDIWYLDHHPVRQCCHPAGWTHRWSWATVSHIRYSSRLSKPSCYQQPYSPYRYLPLVLTMHSSRIQRSWPWSLNGS